MPKIMIVWLASAAEINNDPQKPTMVFLALSACRAARTYIGRIYQCRAQFKTGKCLVTTALIGMVNPIVRGESYSRITPETRLSYITYPVSEILPPHSPKAIETGKSHKESNY